MKTSNKPVALIALATLIVLATAVIFGLRLFEPRKKLNDVSGRATIEEITGPEIAARISGELYWFPVDVRGSVDFRKNADTTTLRFFGVPHRSSDGKTIVSNDIDARDSSILDFGIDDAFLQCECQETGFSPLEEIVGTTGAELVESTFGVLFSLRDGNSIPRPLSFVRSAGKTAIVFPRRIVCKAPGWDCTTTEFTVEWDDAAGKFADSERDGCVSDASLQNACFADLRRKHSDISYRLKSVRTFADFAKLEFEEDSDSPKYGVAVGYWLDRKTGLILQSYATLVENDLPED